MSTIHKHQLIEKAVIELIEKDILKVGEAVPSIRRMSKLYNMSPTPVIEAYKNLEARGLIESHPKSRFTVAASVSENSSAKADLSAGSKTLIVSRRKENPNPYSRQNKNIRLDFARMDMEKGIVPAETCLKPIVRSMKNTPCLLSIDPRGYDDESLVAVISKHMLQSMCAIEKEEICVTGNGIEESIRLALKACTRVGDTVVLTAPCSPVHVYACRVIGINYTFVHPAAGGQSVDIDAFEHMLRKDKSIKCLLISGGLMTPDGYYISTACKKALAEICRKYDIAVVEDDSDAGLCFEGRPPVLFKELIPDQTLYVSSFTTSIINELNVNWVCPGKYARIFRMMRDNETFSPYAFLQTAIASFVETNQYRNHMEFIRNLLRDTISTVRKTIFESFPSGIIISNPEGGYQLHIILPEIVRSIRLKGLAYNSGISICCDNEYFAEGNGVVINCSVIAKDSKNLEGIEKLGELARTAITMNTTK